jgi:bacterioferritin-associated ferredoxin
MQCLSKQLRNKVLYRCELQTIHLAHQLREGAARGLDCARCREQIAPQVVLQQHPAQHVAVSFVRIGAAGMDEDFGDPDK